ncbi:MAG: hypothetical protein WBO10_07700 [Pyrinomonadaceae bacterium]
MLMSHGSVKEAEIPCIMDASTSWFRQRQMNAARLIVLADGDENVIYAAKKKIISETKHVEIWMYILDIGLALKKPGYDELAKLRPDMIKQALEYKNPDSPRLEGKIQSTGLRAGMIAGIPGIEEEVKKRLESNNVDILEVALDAMPQQMTIDELPRLTQMLTDYEGGKEYKGLRSTVFSALICALVRSEDERAYALAKKAIEVDLTNINTVNGSRKEYGQFRNKIVFIPGDQIEKFCFYLIRENGPSAHFAFDLIETRITRKISEPTVEAVKACVNVLERGDPRPANYPARMKANYYDPSSDHCAKLFHYLGGDGSREQSGDNYLPFGKKWLEENGGGQ